MGKLSARGVSGYWRRSVGLHRPCLRNIVFTCMLLSSPYLAPVSFVKSGAFRQILPRRGCAQTAASSTAKGKDMLDGDVVTVIGASGNVGKLTTLRLLDETYKVRAVVRSSSAKDRLANFLGEERSKLVEFFEADTASAPQGLEEALRGSAAAVVCTGTTAFPTKAWAGGGVKAEDIGSRVWEALSSNGFDVRKGLEELTSAGLNTPDAVDAHGVEAVVRAACNAAKAGTFKRLILMSSIGVTRRTGFPFVVLNAAGVLDAKAQGEAAAETAAKREGFSWTVVRPGQLFGGPYDNNFYLGTLFQLDKGAATRAVDVTSGDTAAGDTLRSTLAEVLVQTLKSDATHNTDFTVINVEGEAPSATDIQEIGRAHV